MRIKEVKLEQIAQTTTIEYWTNPFSDVWEPVEPDDIQELSCTGEEQHG